MTELNKYIYYPVDAITGVDYPDVNNIFIFFIVIH